MPPNDNFAATSYMCNNRPHILKGLGYFKSNVGHAVIHRLVVKLPMEFIVFFLQTNFYFLGEKFPENQMIGQI